MEKLADVLRVAGAAVVTWEWPCIESSALPFHVEVNTG